MKRLILLLFLSSSLLIDCSDNTTGVEDGQISEEIEQELYAYFDSLQTNTPIPGIVAGIWSPKQDINWVKSFGYANLEDAIPMTSELKFRIASNTKTMTNTILLQLCDENKISLSDTLSQYISNFPKADEVTIQMLTDMTSGIPEYVNSPKINEWLARNPGIYFPLDTLISFGAEMDYYFEPGKGWKYSNTNTLLIQKIIEKITGNSLKHEMRNRIFDPLGLTKTVYLASGTEIPDPHPQGYYSQDVIDPPPNYTEVLDISLVHGAGAVVSNIDELRTYVENLVNGGYLSSPMQQHRLNQLVTPDSIPLPLQYGTGWMEFNGFYGHDGGFPGFSSLMVSHPVNKTTVIFWFNCQLADYNVLDSFARVYEILYEENSINGAKKFSSLSKIKY